MGVKARNYGVYPTGIRELPALKDRLESLKTGKKGKSEAIACWGLKES